MQATMSLRIQGSAMYFSVYLSWGMLWTSKELIVHVQLYTYHDFGCSEYLNLNIQFKLIFYVQLNTEIRVIS